MKAYVFKLYHSKSNKHLAGKINLAGSIYNHLIALHRRYYKLFGQHLSVVKIQRHITRLKKTPRFAHWNKLGSQAIQDIAQRIERAYNLFFRNLQHGIKTAPPSFKKVRKYRSFTLKQAGYKLLEENQIKIMGRIYKYAKSREIGCTIKTLTVKRDTLGDFWLCFVVDEEIGPINVRTGKSVGLDFGLKTFLTTSDAEKIQSPMFMRKASREIKRLSRKVSTKKPGSNNREKARLDLARKHRNIANQRKDYHFKQAHALVSQYAEIFIEDLNIKAMQRLWGRKISDLGHAQFISTLFWVIKKQGVYGAKIDRFYPSSKTCSSCLHELPELPLSIREWTCPICGSVHDRDVNAARNIFRVGASTCKGESVRLAPASGF
ncbi:MAG: transposase [Desulfovibrio sp.]|jgi:putative transposase|nr:transposase [Desulfovibrio sp.]